jgi:hypothetical protein
LARCSSSCSISGSATAEPLREQLHGFGKTDLFVQLEKLEDVAANATAEAVEEAFVAIDLKGRRFLPVKRAKPFVIGARFFQRHVVLDHDDDVGLLFEIVDESLRKQTHFGNDGQSFSSTIVAPPPPSFCGASS